MLTAHLPSGYILARGLRRRLPWQSPWLMPAALIGAVLPDLDMLWFQFIDHGRWHHHRYWPHIPLVWLVIALVSLPFLTHGRATALVFFAAIFLHLMLDTISGGILWAWPFSDRLFSLVTVPPHQANWVLSFVLHWTFALELGLWAVALWLGSGRKTR